MDREDKFDLYEKRGVQNYWIIDPENKAVEAYVLDEGSYSLAASGKEMETVYLPPFADIWPFRLKDVWPCNLQEHLQKSLSRVRARMTFAYLCHAKSFVSPFHWIAFVALLHDWLSAARISKGSPLRIGNRQISRAKCRDHHRPAGMGLPSLTAIRWMTMAGLIS